MDWTIVAAFAAAGVALVVGLLGPLVSARTTRQTIEAQRRLANADRLWQRRAETYVTLLRWAGEARRAGGRDVVDNPVAMRDQADELRMPLDLEAQMTAYASGAVYSAAKLFLHGVQDSLHANANLLIAATPQASEPQLQHELQRAEQAALESDRLANAMAQLVSDDLHDILPEDSGRTTHSGVPARNRPQTDAQM